MEDLEIKKRFEIVQRVMNLCISSLYTFYEESIIRKKSVLEFSRLKSMLQDESIRITDELSQLYLTYPVIACVQQYYHEKEFLWESTFYESLDKEQKSKWLSYSPLHFQLSTFTANHTAYDKELPYFSIVVRAIVLERYSHFLCQQIESCLLKAHPILQDDESTVIAEEVETYRPKKKTVVGTSNPFHHTLEAWQIKLLTECVNRSRMFTTTLTPEILTDFFEGKLEGVLISNNNRLLAYFMSQLSYREYITGEWQAVIAYNRLVLGKAKKAPLSRTDLSSANDSAKPSPKGSEIIDKYIKELKKH